MKINFKSLKRNHIELLFAIVVMVYPLTYLFTGNWFIAGCISGLLSYFIIVVREHYIQSLQRRIVATNGSNWEVQLNGVKIGTLLDSRYAEIRLKTFEDRRIYIAQAINLGKVVVKAFDYLYINIPIAVFWIVIGFALITPETFSSIYVEAQKTKPDAILAVIKFCVQAFGIFAVMIIFINVMLGARFGFVNHFGTATATVLRTHFQQAAEGDILMVRWIDGSPIINDEMRRVRESVNN